jgi:flagellar motor switch protein FliM
MEIEMANETFSVEVAPGAYQSLQLDDPALLHSLGITVGRAKKGFRLCGPVARLAELRQYAYATSRRDTLTLGESRSAESAYERIRKVAEPIIGPHQPPRPRAPR